MTSTSSSSDYTGPPARKKFAVEGNSAAEIATGARRLAAELSDYSGTPIEHENIVDLQLITCRKLRELLPLSKELLLIAQERNWIPLMLSWLNLHDRPAVQVEALLALTNIAELCAQQQQQQTSSYLHPHQKPTFQEAMEAANKISSKYPYPSSLTPAPGSVPFPPLSFSQTLSPEAVAAFDASLASTIHNSDNNNNNLLKKESKLKSPHPSWSLPPAPLFSSNSTGGSSLTSTPAAPGGGAINFTSLAPPPGGAHSAVPSNAFLPPPTSVGPTFPQQLSASSQHLLLRHADAIPTLISLLSSPNREVYEQAMWILGSIAAGDSPNSGNSGSQMPDSRDSSSNSNSNTGSGSSGTGSTTGTNNNNNNNSNKSVSARDVILAAGVMNQLLRCLEMHPTNLSLQRIGSWTLSNLVDAIFQTSNNSSHNNKNNNNSGSNNNNNNANSKTDTYSSADEIDMNVLLPVLKRLLHMTDSEVLSYTCWTLSHLCDGPSSHIAAVVTTPPELSASEPPGGLVPRLVDLLLHSSWRVTKPALRTIGNIVCAECSDDAVDYTEVILECNAVPRLKELVTHSNREIQKEACWTLSNIAAGTVDQIQAVIDSGAIRPLVQLVQDKKTDQEVRSEACWVVLNATSCGSDSQIEVLVDEGCVSVLGVLLSEASMVMMALEGLERVLQVEETRELLRREQNNQPPRPTLVSAALIEKARESHNSSAVTKRAERIWKQHFVSCALCRKSFSKHRTCDATFCEECKCHVCSNCNCRIYHLDYQEELWAASEKKEESVMAKKNAKKSKNKKKKLKQKNKQKTVVPAEESGPQHANNGSTSSINNNSSSNLNAGNGSILLQPMEQQQFSLKETGDEEEEVMKKISPAASFDEEDDDEDQIDFVLYLQQTGSIIALAKLMDALEYEELDDYERKMIREQQLMKANPAHS